MTPGEDDLSGNDQHFTGEQNSAGCRPEALGSRPWKVLSIRAPWWWWIFHGKDIENRDWYTSYRGPVLIHASKWWNAEDARDDFYSASDMYDMQPLKRDLPYVTLRMIRDFGGHVVGSANIVDCVRKSDSPWFVGKFGFVLADQRLFETPLPLKGQLGLFDAPPGFMTATAVKKVGNTLSENPSSEAQPIPTSSHSPADEGKNT